MVDTVTAILNNRAAQASGVTSHRVFDWVRAATLIAERKPVTASAGLGGDWEWTGGCIYRNDAPVPQDDTYTFLLSSWATPELEIDGETIDCWLYDHECGWDSDTYWPESAREILRAAGIYA